MKRFHTRAAANEGVKVPLAGPDGEPTEFFIHLIGLDSDAFRKKRLEVNRESLLRASMAGAKTPDDALALGDAFHAQQKLKLLACLITGWNFTTEDGTNPQPLPCTEENIIAFLREAPQIADMIDRLAADRAFFTTAHSKASTSGQEENSTSASPPQGEAPPETP